MAKRRTENWLLLIIPAIGLIPVALLGLWGYMILTALSLHPVAEEAPSVTSSDPSPEWAGAVREGRQIVRAALTTQNLPGLSVAVGAAGDLVWAEGFGWADLEGRVPVAPETRFRIGTASTALTSAAVGLLLEEGRLDLDAEIQTSLPEFPRNPVSVTLRQLMGHVAGVRNDGGDEGPLFSQHCDGPADALPHFAARALIFEPGTQYRYSSHGWIVVSAAVESAANQPFLTFMRQRVLEPLGMRDTSADAGTEPVPGGDAVPGVATHYFPRFGADPRWGLHLMRPINLSCYSGASVFLSTPSDLVRYGMAINAGKLLQPETVRLLQTPLRLASGEETGYGLGWEVETVTLAGEPARLAGHDGTSLGGPVASLLTFPDRGIAVAVLSNISYTDTRAVALQIAQTFAEQQSTLRR